MTFRTFFHNPHEAIFSSCNSARYTRHSGEHRKRIAAMKRSVSGVVYPAAAAGSTTSGDGIAGM
jgi:hypothetical protein